MRCLDRDNAEDGEKDQPDGEILFRKAPYLGHEACGWGRPQCPTR